jgi:hypothetical protein
MDNLSIPVTWDFSMHHISSNGMKILRVLGTPDYTASDAVKIVDWVRKRFMYAFDIFCIR